MAHGSTQRGLDWALYAAHREAFTRTVLAAAPNGGRLCLLGAGKCNDLDLARLAERFHEVHLVDLLPASVAGAVSRETPPVRQRLVPHAPVDLSLLSPKRTSKWKRSAPTESELQGCVDITLQGLLARLPGPFDVVVSACVLTQLGFALTQNFPPSSLLGALRVAVTRLHLQTLLGLTAPHGSALLVTDVASSSHYPLQTLPPDADLNGVLDDVVRQRAFYHVAQPAFVSDLLNELAPDRPVRRLSPWLWTGPEDRTYLVYGYEIATDSSSERERVVAKTWP